MLMEGRRCGVAPAHCAHRTARGSSRGSGMVGDPALAPEQRHVRAPPASKCCMRRHAPKLMEMRAVQLALAAWPARLPPPPRSRTRRCSPAAARGAGPRRRHNPHRPARRRASWRDRAPQAGHHRIRVTGEPRCHHPMLRHDGDAASSTLNPPRPSAGLWPRRRRFRTRGSLNGGRCACSKPVELRAESAGMRNSTETQLPHPGRTRIGAGPPALSSYTMALSAPVEGRHPSSCPLVLRRTCTRTASRYGSGDAIGIGAPVLRIQRSSTMALARRLE
jgi:hypothetical protein